MSKFPSLRDRVDILVRILFGAFIAIGCLMVVWPFTTGILVAGVIALVSWPLFLRIRKFFRGNATLASLSLSIALTLLILLPIAVLTLVTAQEIPEIVKGMREWIVSGLTIPESIKTIPWFGEWLFDQISGLLGDKEELIRVAQKLVDPVSHFLLSSAVVLGDGIIQIALVIFVIFFFYRDGEYLSGKCQKLLERMSGSLSHEVGDIIVSTTRSVVFGIVGSAAAQGLVAMIGFFIAGVPGAVTLGAAVFILSVVPIGPPLVWIPAAIWLYSNNELGMAIFLVAWGGILVSSVDNVVKPLLISKGSSLPLALIYLGVFGGILAFGFMGIILGPVLLAVGIAMSRTWLTVSATLGKNEKPTMKTKQALVHLSEETFSEIPEKEEK